MMNSEEKNVYDIAELIRRAGGRALLAGGCVRDKLMGGEPHDFDMEVYGLNADEIIRALNGHWELDLVGMSFGVMKVRHCNIDIALPRTESKTGRGHRGFMVTPQPDLDFATAAARRDFTVNAIMMDALTGEIIDPHHGQDDLKRGILRHVSSHFSEDPLRVLRGMQFIGRFNFTAAPETIQLCAQLSQHELAAERIAGEWDKLLLQGCFPAAGLRFLRAVGWVDFYPELAALINCPQDPRWHPEGDVWEHTLNSLDAAAFLRPADPDDALVLMLAALCHDFGKPACTILHPDGKISSSGHDTLTEPAEHFISSIWLRRDLCSKVIPLIRTHMQPWQLIRDGSSDRAFRRLSLAAKRMDLLALLVECDVRGIACAPEKLAEKLHLLNDFRRRTRELELSATPPQPLIMGRHLLARGVKPGKEMKPLLDRCFEAQIEGVFHDLPGAMKFLDSLL